MNDAYHALTSEKDIKIASRILSFLEVALLNPSNVLQKLRISRDPKSQKRTRSRKKGGTSTARQKKNSKIPRKLQPKDQNPRKSFVDTDQVLLKCFY
jgi:hypothetical protein